MEIRALHEADDRRAFQCGDDDLDRFFHRFAGQNQFRHHIGTTYVATDGTRIVGYATVAPGHVEIDRLPVATARKLPGYPLPILRLSRLAVDKDAQGQGIGRVLLRFVLELGARLAREYGCIGVIVDAKPGAIAFYTRYGFAPLDALEGELEARPAPRPMFLPIADVIAAVRPLAALLRPTVCERRA